MPDRIHIVGASGSGTTSLAVAIAADHGHRHLDTDDFFWLPPIRRIGGRRHQASVEFLEWAGRYDAGRMEMRSRACHETWLSSLPAPVLRLEGDRSVGEQLKRVELHGVR